MLHLPMWRHQQRRVIMRSRTSDSLNERLPIKWPEKSFKENDIYSMKMIVSSTSIIRKSVFLIGQVPIKNMG